MEQQLSQPGPATPEQGPGPRHFSSVRVRESEREQEKEREIERESELRNQRGPGSRPSIALTCYGETGTWGKSTSLGASREEGQAQVRQL